MREKGIKGEVCSRRYFNESQFQYIIPKGDQ